MLRLSRKIDYAILAIAHLSPRTVSGPLSSRCLAERSRIPAALLANILKDLCRLGLIRSIRGARGGYELAVRPADLSVGELLRRLEGAPKLVECVPDGLDENGDLVGGSSRAIESHGSRSTGACDLEALCPVKAPLRKLHDRIHEVLDELTFDQLAVVGGTELIAAAPDVSHGAEEKGEDT